MKKHIKHFLLLSLILLSFCGFRHVIAESVEVPDIFEEEHYAQGDTGETVSWIQESLKTLGFYDREITGHFGTRTEEAVRLFQREYGLVEDGIVYQETIEYIREALRNDVSTRVDVTLGPAIYKLDWFIAKNNGFFSALGLEAEKRATLTDLTTGKSLMLYIQSAGNHLDVEPLTAADTKVLCSIYSVSEPNSISYVRRAMLLTTASGYQIVCSVYGVPHGEQLIADNNYYGQFCVHFTNSRTSGTDKVDADHQAAIQNAIAKLEAETGTTVTTISISLPERSDTSMTYDASKHYWVDSLGNVLSSGEHVVFCSEPGFCAICGAEGLTVPLSHGTRVYHDQNSHFFICPDCGEVISSETHTALCITPNTCSICGAENANCDITHGVNRQAVPAEEPAYSLNYHAIVCSDCGQFISYESHSSCCVAPNICTVCGAEEVRCSVSHGKYETIPIDNRRHGGRCVDCGYIKPKKSAHRIKCTSTENICEVCSFENPEIDSVYHTSITIPFDKKAHHIVCTDCNALISASYHFAECTDATTCEECGATDIIAQNIWHHGGYSFDYQHDNSSHWMICGGCGEEIERNVHYADCTKPNECNTCKATNVQIVSIDHGNRLYQYNESQCWTICADCKEVSTPPHPHQVSCSSPSVCVKCGANVTDGYELSHSFSNNYAGDDSGHWRICNDCGAKSDIELHFQWCNETKCEDCGYEGNFNLNIHHAIARIEGYDRNSHWVFCDECGEKVSEIHTATCLDQSKCTSCGAPAEEITFESIDHYYKNVNGVAVCELCGWRPPTTEQHEHQWIEADVYPSGHICSICGLVATEEDLADYKHDLIFYDAQNHYFFCGMWWRVTGQEPHTFENGTCIVCGYSSDEVIPTSGDWQYRKQDGSAVIVAYLGSQTDVSLPEKLGAFPVTGIAADAFIDTPVAALTIPESVSSIEQDALFGISTLRVYFGSYALQYVQAFNLPYEIIDEGGFLIEDGVLLRYTGHDSDIVIPEGVHTIGERAFADCGEISSVSFPQSLRRIEAFAFGGKHGWTQTVALSNEMEYLAPYAFGTLNNICLTAEDGSYAANWIRRSWNGEHVINSTFQIDANGRLTHYSGSSVHVVVPDGVTCIGGWAFESYKITSIDLPDSLTEIEYGAFVYCDNLHSLTLPDNITRFGGNYIVPSSCELIWKSGTVTDKTIQKLSFDIDETTNKLIRYNGFDTSVTVPDGIEIIGEYAFGSRVLSVELPDSVHELESWAFRNSYDMKSITLPDYITIMGDNNIFPSNCEVIWNKETETDATLQTYSFQMDEDHKTLIRYRGFDSHITVPNGVEVLGNESFRHNQKILSVTLPDSLSAIEKYAFYNCRSLLSVIIPENVKTVGAYAFMGDIGLRVTLPDNLESIGINAFKDVKKVYYNPGTLTASLMEGKDFVVENGVLTGYYGSDSDVIVPDGVKVIGGGAFNWKTKLTSVTLPEGVIKIESGAFASCTALTSIHLPSTLTSIGPFAFEGCGKLKNIVLPENLTSLEEGAFNRCSSLIEINIPDSVTSIGWGTFSFCTSLRRVTLGTSVERIDDEAFLSTSLESIEFPAALRSIGNSAFAYSNLKEVTLPASLERVDDVAFAYCQDLTSVTIEGPMTMGYGLFTFCINLTDVTMKEGGTAVADQMFSCCASLTNVHLPSTLTTICEMAFDECRSLENIELPNGLTSIGADAFSLCTKLTTLTLPSSLQTIGGHAFDACPSLTVAVYPDSYAMQWCQKNSIPYQVISPVETNILRLPSFMQRIEAEAFAGIGADTVYIPSACQEIQSRAFANSSIHIIHFASRITKIADDAFEDCSLLIVYCPEGGDAERWCQSHGIAYQTE